jgi:hypothetical protein
MEPFVLKRRAFGWPGRVDTVFEPLQAKGVFLPCNRLSTGS